MTGKKKAIQSNNIYREIPKLQMFSNNWVHNDSKKKRKLPCGIRLTQLEKRNSEQMELTGLGWWMNSCLFAPTSNYRYRRRCHVEGLKSWQGIFLYLSGDSSLNLISSFHGVLADRTSVPGSDYHHKCRSFAYYYLKLLGNHEWFYCWFGFVSFCLSIGNPLQYFFVGVFLCRVWMHCLNTCMLFMSFSLDFAIKPPLTTKFWMSMSSPVLTTALLSIGCLCYPCFFKEHTEHSKDSWENIPFNSL